jgi:hypothetical protein
LAPLTFHWYDGVGPPFPGVAVNITKEPGQKGFGLATMDTPAGNDRLAIIVMVLDVSGFPVGQGSEDVRMQNTRSRDAGMYE